VAQQPARNQAFLAGEAVNIRDGVGGNSHAGHSHEGNSGEALGVELNVGTNGQPTLRDRIDALWNWKSALLSAVLRALVFLAINWTSGRKAAGMAMGVEFSYRILTSGFYGSLIQSFRKVQPAWRANLYVILLLPALNQGLDLWVHWLNGTPKLAASLVASTAITVWAALFNLYAMRRGALVTGRDARPLRDDLRQLPALVADFCLIVPRFLRHNLTLKGACAK
jgi:hypothetical protein